MYITTDRWRTGYNRDGSQKASGLFLIIVTSEAEQYERRPKLAAVVRKVNMEQLGHFMMGNATIGGQEVVLSGAYGSDGLPKRVPPAVFEQCIPIPEDLEEAFWNGGGHNSAGAEAPALRAWALENKTRLHRAART